MEFNFGVRYMIVQVRPGVYLKCEFIEKVEPKRVKFRWPTGREEVVVETLVDFI